MSEFSPENRGLGEVAARVATVLDSRMLEQEIAFGELAIRVAAADIVHVMEALRDDPELRFISFIDICGVD